MPSIRIATFAGLTLLLLGSFSAALAFSGTPQEQQACAPDARRLCSKVTQDEMTVLSCLVQQRTKLSQACRQVLVRYGQIPPS
jgi:Cysteine rich repeat